MKITNCLHKYFKIFVGGKITISCSETEDRATLILSIDGEMEEILLLNPRFSFIHNENEQRTIQIHGFYRDENGVFSSLRIWCQYD